MFLSLLPVLLLVLPPLLLPLLPLLLLLLLLLLAGDSGDGLAGSTAITVHRMLPVAFLMSFVVFFYGFLGYIVYRDEP